MRPGGSRTLEVVSLLQAWHARSQPCRCQDCPGAELWLGFQWSQPPLVSSRPPTPTSHTEGPASDVGVAVACEASRLQGFQLNLAVAGGPGHEFENSLRSFRPLRTGSVMGFVRDVHFCRPHSRGHGRLELWLCPCELSVRPPCSHSSSHRAGHSSTWRERPASHGGTGSGPCLLTWPPQQVAEPRLTPGGGPRSLASASHCPPRSPSIRAEFIFFCIATEATIRDPRNVAWTFYARSCLRLDSLAAQRRVNCRGFMTRSPVWQGNASCRIYFFRNLKRLNRR